MTIPGISSLGGLSSGSISSSTVIDKEVEKVTDNIATYFKELMEKIQKITDKDPKNLTEGDIIELGFALQRLEDLRRNGLTPAMIDASKLIERILAEVGITSSHFNVTTEELKELQDKMAIMLAKVKMGDKEYSFAEIMKILLDPNQRAADTKSIGDMLLDLMTKRSADYEAKLKEFKEQVDFAKKIMEQLNDFQKIFELLEIKLPEGFKFPPATLDDIPKELQEKLRQALNLKDIKDLDMSKINKWLETNKGQYINWCADYFKQDLKIEVNLTTPEALQKLIQMLKTRDNLLKEIEDLKKSGGSADKIAALEKLVKDVDHIFPRDKFPPGSDWTKMLTRPGPDQPEARKKWDETIGNYLGSSYITNWFRNAFTGESDVLNNITNAMNVFKELSSTLTDKLKELNQKFDQFADLCIKVMQELNKILVGFARRPGQ